MKRKLLFPIILMILLSFPNITQTEPTFDRYQIEIFQEETMFSPSQELNISTYLDYAYVTTDLLISEFRNQSDGRLFRWTSSDFGNNNTGCSLSDYYWTIKALARMYEHSLDAGYPNSTLSDLVEETTEKMIELFYDPDYYGFGVNLYSPAEARQTKRAGVQAYAYEALCIAENINPLLDYSIEKTSAICCITDMLYDEVNGGFYFFTMRNGSIVVPSYLYEIYDNDGKRLDHLALGIIALYDAWSETGNSTLYDMATNSLDFIVDHMRNNFQGIDYGYMLAVCRNGSSMSVESGMRPASTVVTDLNAIAIRSLLKGYEITGDSNYLEKARNAFNTLIDFNWDSQYGAFFAETLNGEPFDPADDEDVKYFKYSEIQFQTILTLEEMFEVTDDYYYVRIITDILERVISHLWDSEDGGFIANGNQEWETLSPDWQVHYTAVQGQGILALENVWSYGLPIVSHVRVNPTNPRPTDSIVISTTATDDDGIEFVIVNYTISLNGEDTDYVLELPPHPQYGGIYNTTIEPMEDGTQVNFVVTAIDEAGTEFTAGIYYFVVRADVYEPVVIMRQIYPGEPRIGDDVIVEFGTYEFPRHSLIDSCILYWKLNDGAYKGMNMTWVDIEDDYFIWRALLGQFNGGDIISYYCLAEDESGNVGQSSFYRLTILGSYVNIDLTTVYQTAAAFGLMFVPVAGFFYYRARKEASKGQQRDLKRMQKKKSRRKPPTEKGGRRRRGG